MNFGVGSPVGKSYAAFTLGAALLLAFAFAGMSVFIIAAIVGGTLVVALLLKIPAWMLLAAVASGPMFGGWLDASVGGGVQATIDRALLVAITFFMAVRWLRRPAAVLPVSRVELLMLTFVLVAAVSALVRGGSQGSGTKGGLRLDFVFLVQSYGAPFLLFFLAKNVLREVHLKWLLRVYVAVGVFVSAVAVLQYFTGITTFSPTRYEAIHIGRAAGTLGTAPHFGIVMAVSLLAALVLLLRSNRPPTRATLAVLIVFMLAAIFLSKTRAVYLGLAVSMAIAAIYTPRIRRTLAVMGLVGLTATVVAWPMIARTDFVANRLFDIVPVYNRIALWGTAANMVVHRPIAGFGFGQKTFLEERGEYFTQVGQVSSSWAYTLGVPHNEYLNVLVGMGLVGFIPYFFIIVLLWKNVARVVSRNGLGHDWVSDAALVALASLGMYIINGMFTETGHCWYGSNMVYCLLGAVEGNRIRAGATPALRAG